MLVVVTDVSTPLAVVIFRVKWRVNVRFAVFMCVWFMRHKWVVVCEKYESWCGWLFVKEVCGCLLCGVSVVVGIVSG